MRERMDEHKPRIDRARSQLATRRDRRKSLRQEFDPAAHAVLRLPCLQRLLVDLEEETLSEHLVGREPPISAPLMRAKKVLPIREAELALREDAVEAGEGAGLSELVDQRDAPEVRRDPVFVVAQVCPPNR